MNFLVYGCLNDMEKQPYNQDELCIYFHREMERLIFSITLSEIERDLINNRIDRYIICLYHRRKDHITYLGDSFEIDFAIEEMRKVKELLNEAGKDDESSCGNARCKLIK